MRKDKRTNLDDVKVGDPATVCYWSDRDPATVIEVKGKRVIVQLDSWKVVSGHINDGSAEYEYERNPEGRIMVFSLRKNGRLVARGGNARSGTGLGLGYRRHYYDPHF